MVDVSVVLCTHNGDVFLSQQLDSIVNQSLTPGEIVISDDASSDGTPERLASFRKRMGKERPDITIRVLQNGTVLGVARNFESALRASSGQWIALSDQDDIWHENKLHALVGLAEHSAGSQAFTASRGDSSRFSLNEREVLLVNSDACLIDSSGRSLGKSLFDALRIRRRSVRRICAGHGLKELMKRNVVTGATTLISRRLLDLALPIPSAWLHDEWLAVVAALYGGLTTSSLRLIDYRQHDANVIGAKGLTWAMRMNRLSSSRGERNSRLVARAQQLHDFCQAHVLDLDPVDTQLVQQKLRHERARDALPVARWRRVRPILGETIRGGYFSAGLGLADILRDLLQPR